MGGAGADFTIGALADGIEKLKVANAPEPYYAVLPSTQWAVLALTDELIRFDIRGEGNTIVAAQRQSRRPARTDLLQQAELIESRWGLPAKKWLRLFKPVC